MEEYPYTEADLDMQQEEDTDDQLEKQQEAQQEFFESAPGAITKDDLFSLFWKVIQIKDSSKVSNLDKQERGMLNWAVRDCQHIRLLGETLGHKQFGDYFGSMGEVVLSTSASKKGWLGELFVSQKKASIKAREIRQDQLAGTQPRKKRWRLR
jgi:hypothetical protein